MNQSDKWSCGGDWLVAFADDELAGDDREQATKHLAGCATCRAELAALRASLLLIQTQWRSPLASDGRIVGLPQRVRENRRATALVRAALIAGIALILVWQIRAPRDPAVAIIPPANIVPRTQPVNTPDLTTDAALADWLQRETQIARLRTASALLAQEPGMKERGEQLEEYLSKTYGN